MHIIHRMPLFVCFFFFPFISHMFNQLWARNEVIKADRIIGSWTSSVGGGKQAGIKKIISEKYKREEW